MPDELKPTDETNSPTPGTEIEQTRHHGAYYVSEAIVGTIADIARLENPSSAIVLNANYGEFLSKLTWIKNLTSVGSNTSSIDFAEHLSSNITIENVDPASYSTSRKFDVVVAFPPPGLKVVFDKRRIASEALYTEKALELLGENGIAILIVSNDFLTGSLYAKLRSKILTSYGLLKIISFPPGSIKETKVEFSVLVVSKSNAPETNFYSFDPDFNTATTPPSFSVPKGNLTERWDFHFHNPENQTHEQNFDGIETKALGDLVEVLTGRLLGTKGIRGKGEYRIISPRNISRGYLEQYETDRFLEEDDITSQEQRSIVEFGDILISRFHREKGNIYTHASNGEKLIANEHILILRGEGADYVARYLETDAGISAFNEQVHRRKKGITLPTISRSELSRIKIPILPKVDLEYASRRKLEGFSPDKLSKIRATYGELRKQAELSEPHNQILRSLTQQLDQILENQNHILKNQARDSQELNLIHSKVDMIQSLLANLSGEFKAIQLLPRSVEEKLSRMNEKLDEQLSHISKEQKQIDFYVREIKKWLEHYDLLENKSQKYLPEAEYILDKFSTLEDPDYSPFVIQYCRALENELLNKIFRAYVQFVIDRGISVEAEFALDFQLKANGKPKDEVTYKFASNIRKYITKDSERWRFELGAMGLVLQKLSGSNLRRSPILQDLNKFVLARFEKELLNVQYLSDIETIVKNYRNPSAHPNLINAQRAIEFHKKMKECLISLMENYKT